MTWWFNDETDDATTSTSETPTYVAPTSTYVAPTSTYTPPPLRIYLQLLRTPLLPLHMSSLPLHHILLLPPMRLPTPILHLSHHRQLCPHLPLRQLPHMSLPALLPML